MKQKMIQLMMLLGLVLSVVTINQQVFAQELAETSVGLKLIKVPNGSEFPSKPEIPSDSNGNGQSGSTNKIEQKVQIQFVTQPSKLPQTGEQGSLWGLLGWGLLGAACLVYAKKEKERKKNNGTI